MAEATDRSPLQFKRKAITAFLPYAVWQERNGQPEMLLAIIRAVRASRMPALMWCHACSFAHTLFSRASPRAIVFVSPHIFRYTSYDRERWLQQWAVAVPTVPYTEEVAQSVVDMLLQFASTDLPSRPIIADLWTWLTKRPSLPPICFGRDVGTHRRALRAVWELGDIEILKSYFLLVWSEWNGILSNNPLDTSEWPLTHGISFNCPLSSGTPNTSILFSHSLRMMQMAIWEDFGGVGMGNHRADLVRHLDRVLAKLDLGLRFLEQGNQETNADDLEKEGSIPNPQEDVAGVDHSYVSFDDYTPPYTDPGWTQDPAQDLCVHSPFRAHSLATGTFDAPTPCFVRASAFV